MKKIIGFYLTLTVFFVTIFIVFMNYSKKSDIDSFANKQLEVLQRTYQTILNMQASNAQKEFVYLVQDNPKVIGILKQAQKVDKDKLPILRGMLYRELYRFYESALNKQMRQLHFHTSKGDSFLRFHKPALNGDNLFKIRQSIKLANTQKVQVHGFEGGRVFPGFRNVFPIVVDAQHLGSVEFSYPFEAIEKEFRKVLNSDKFQLIQSKSSTIDIVDEQFKNHFIPSSICTNYVIENPNISSISNKIIQDIHIKDLDEKLKICQELDKALKNQTAHFYKPIVHQNRGYLVNFLKVDSVNNDEHAYIVSYESMPELLYIQDKYNFFTLIGSIGIVIVFFSITILHFRKLQINKKNEEIQAQAAFLHKIIENTPIPIFYKDKKGVYIDCNSAFLHLLGFEDEKEIIGKTVFDVYPKDLAQNYANMDAKVFDLTQNPQKYTYKIRNKKTGQIIDNVEFYKSAYFDEKQNVEGLVGALIEMNEVYKNFEEKEKFYSVAQNSPNIIVLTDLDGIIEYVNPAFSKITDFRKEEVIGKNAYNLGNADADEIKTALSEKKMYTKEVKNKKKDGGSYIQKTQIVPYYDRNGRVSGYASVGEDVTQLKELEKIRQEYTQKLESSVSHKVSQLRKKDGLLIQQSKMAAMGEMIGAIAHQWRQPLNALNINIQLLEDDYEDNLIDKKYIDNFTQKMLHKIRYMDSTIDDFRNFFKEQKENTHFNVAKSIDDTLKLIDASFNASNIEVIKDEFDDTCIALGRQNEFNQVLINLFKNSKDAFVQKSIKHGEIHIKLECNSSIVLEIFDNAGGMDDAALKKAFEPYFTTKGESGGTGIGLYMSKVIIEKNMGGKIMLENYKDGVKATIKLAT